MRQYRRPWAETVSIFSFVVVVACHSAATRAQDSAPAEQAAEPGAPASSPSSDAPASEAAPAEDAPAEGNAPAAEGGTPADERSELESAADEPQAAPSAVRQGPTDPAELEAFVDGLMAAALEEKHIAGATFAYVVDGRPFFSKGYGHADVAAGQPVDVDATMFRVGSVSKLFVWTAVMRLAEEGKLDLDADVNEYLEAFKIPATYAEPITLKHLLSHTPGFEDRVIGLFAHSAEGLVPLGELLAKDMPARVRPPGKLIAYSNHGTALAGYIVEQVAGRPWEEYIEETILNPLGMQHTTVRQPPEDKLPPELSKGYKWKRGQFVEQGFEYVPPAPAGSMSASAGDMVKFLIAHLDGGAYGEARILSAETTRKMHSQLFTQDPRIEGMAYGFMRQKFGDVLVVEHGGDTFAFHSHFVMFPQQRSGYFVSFNTTTGGGVRDKLLEAIKERYYSPAQEETLAAASEDFAQRAAKYVGEYGSIRHAYTSPAKLGALLGVANVQVDDDQLVVSFTGSKEVMRFAEAEPGLFREVDGPRTVAFEENCSQPAKHLFIGGVPTAFARLPRYESPLFSLALVAGCIGVLVTAVVGWPLAAFINWGHAGESRVGAGLATWLAWFTSLAMLVTAGLGITLFSDPEQIAFGMPKLMTGLILSAPVTIGFVGLVLLCTLVAWVRGYWRFSGRVHYTLVAAAAGAFAWFLYHWNLVGPIA